MQVQPIIVSAWKCKEITRLKNDFCIISFTTEQKNVQKAWTYKEVTLVQETVENANEANTEADEHNESLPKTNKKQKLGIDYFNNQESDPKKSGALSKSLSFYSQSFLFLLSTPLAQNHTPMSKHDSFNKKRWCVCFQISWFVLS